MAEAIGLTASIIGIIQLTGKLVSVGYGYIGGVNRAHKDLQDLMDELHSFTKVLVVLENCVNTSPGSSALRELEGELQNCADELEDLLAELKPKGKVASLRWPLKEKETMQRVERIERFKGLFAFAVAADNMALSRAIEGHVKKTSIAVGGIEKRLKDTSEVVRGIQTAQRSRKEQEEASNSVRVREKVLEWLYAEDLTTKHVEISSRRQKGTGNWLLRSPEFRAWEAGQSASRLLWGHGIPGAGKTFLSSVVIDHFETQASKHTHGLAHIYFDYKEQDRQKPTQILSSLLKQLLYQLPDLPASVISLYHRLKRKNKMPNIEELYTSLLETASSFPRVIFVFDALDECHPDTQRCGFLPLLSRMGNDRINVFLTSRPHPEDIQNHLQNAVKIELSAQEEDITTYIEQKIEENPRARRLVLQGKCKARILSVLVDCAKGMFLLVRFHIEFLCKQTSAKQILKALDKLKGSSTGEILGSLYPMYDRAMESIRSQHASSSDLAFTIFLWLVRARRTLTVEELREAVAIDQDQYELDPMDLIDRATLVDVCAGLVIIDEHSDTIKLAHYTVQEYLLENGLIPTDAELRLAIACTTYLSFDTLGTLCTSVEELDDRRASHPFLHYAATQISHHQLTCDEDLTTDAVLEFLSRSGNVGFFVQYTSFTQGYPFDQLIKGRTTLHVAAIFGHLNAVRSVLEMGNVSISTQDNQGRTALHLAAAGGRDSIVRLLLEMGAETSPRDHNGVKPTYRAADLGHNSVLNLPTENGAGSELVDKDNSGQTSLHYAARLGHETTVLLLLEKGLDIEASDKWGNTPLHIAAFIGQEAVIRVLLSKGADIEATEDNGRTALHCAAAQGHVSVVRLLLDSGAYVRARDLNGETPLHRAATLGRQEVVSLLLENGASVWALDSLGRTPQQCAALLGHKEVIFLLIQRLSMGYQLRQR